MRLIQYQNPFNQEVDEFSRFFDWAFPAWSQRRSEASHKPAVDFFENKEGYRLEAELPGFSKEEITLDHQNGVLTLKAVKDAGQDGEKSRRSVERAITLPEDVAVDKIQAQLNHGVLEVSLPRREELKPARIEIK